MNDFYYTDMDREHKRIRKEASRLAQRHQRSYSLILFRGQESYSKDGSEEMAIKEMRDYCHAKKPPQ